MANGSTIDIARGKACINVCGTVEALRNMYVHVADETAPTAEELANAICSDCAKIRGTLGRVRIGDLAAFRPAPKPKHVREPRQVIAVVAPQAPKPVAPAPRPAPRPTLGSVPQPLPRPLHKKGKPKHLPRPAAVGGLKKMRVAGLQKAQRELRAKLEQPRMNEIENYAERLRVQAQLLEIESKLNS